MHTIDASLADRTDLADWRRRVAALYVEVRAVAASDPPAAWAAWRAEREALYRGHPSSPLPAGEREAFRARHWPYDDRLRFVVGVEPSPPALGIGGLAGLELPNSGADTLAFDRVGRLRLPLPDGDAELSLFWMRGYAGGLFLPFRDATSGDETYGAGRYVLDTAKGADLGGDPVAGTLVVDLNFAYQPSCAFDPKWACPLAPPENRLAARVEAGERLR
jgi:uncharacterized protein (DUF1684 family)